MIYYTYSFLFNFLSFFGTCVTSVCETKSFCYSRGLWPKYYLIYTSQYYRIINLLPVVSSIREKECYASEQEGMSDYTRLFNLCLKIRLYSSSETLFSVISFLFKPFSNWTKIMKRKRSHKVNGH